MLEASPSSLNSIDRGIIRIINKIPIFNLTSHAIRVREARLRRAILLYSDQQILTEIAILLSAFIQLRTDGSAISAYHWQIAVYLAWFASASHLSSLAILRHHFREHSRVRNVRFGLMLLAMALLLVALIPTGDLFWLLTLGDNFLGSVPAICYFKRIGTDVIVPKNSRGFTFLISTIVLISSTLTKSIFLSTKASKYACQILERPFSAWETRLNKGGEEIRQKRASRLYKVIYFWSCVGYLFLRACRDLFQSTFWEVCAPNSDG